MRAATDYPTDFAATTKLSLTIRSRIRATVAQKRRFSLSVIPNER